MCELLSEIIRDEGYSTLSASGGPEALKLLEKERVDLLLSDIKMPEMDGFELAQKVAERYPHIKIQLMSAYSETGNHNLIPDELCKQLLSKPIDPNKLLLCIQKLLN